MLLAEERLRPHAEEAYAAELVALEAVDDKPRPPRWRLSPWAVVTYLMGGTLPDGTEISAKYIGAQPLLGVNPDPNRFDGQLLPFDVDDVRVAVTRTIEGKMPLAEVTLARAQTSDGQTLLAFNDLFIGETTHQSAHYRLWTSSPAKKKAPRRSGGGAGGAAAVGGQDRPGNRGRRRVAVAGVDQRGDVVGDQHLDRAGGRRLGERVRVGADEERAVVPLRLAVFADRLRGREDVVLVEGRLQRRAAVAAGAERDLLIDVLGVGGERVVGGHQPGHVDQVTGLGRLSGAGGHGPIMAHAAAAL